MQDENVELAVKISVGLGERIKEAVKIAGGMSVVARPRHEDGTGYAASTIYNYMRLDPSPPIDFVYRLCGLTDCRPEWLFMGELPQRKWQKAEAFADGRRVPIMSARVSAGDGAINDDAESEYQVFSEEFLRTLGNPADLHLIQIKGDSMHPELKDGEWVMVDTSVREAEESIMVVNLDGLALVKRVSFKSGKQIELLSTNTAYPPLAVRDESYVIVGKVVWAGRQIG